MDKGTDKSSTALEQRKVMFESGKLQREFVKQLITPQALGAIAGVLASPEIRQLIALQQRFAGGVIRYLQSPEMQAGLKAIEGLLASTQLRQEIRSASELSAAMERLAGSPLAEYLVSGRGPDLGRLVEASGHAVASVEMTCDARVITAKELELERQIVGALERGDSAGSLPKLAQLRLGLIISLIITLVAWISASNSVRSELCFFQPKLAPAATNSQVGKAARAFLCEADLPFEMLRGYRSVKGTDVRLRSGPSMKAEIVPFDLEDRALLEVLDSSNRDWLLVSVVNEDGLEGWISRKYTHPLLR